MKHHRPAARSAAALPLAALVALVALVALLGAGCGADEAPVALGATTPPSSTSTTPPSSASTTPPTAGIPESSAPAPSTSPGSSAPAAPDLAPLPTSAAELATELTEAEQAVRRTDLDPATVAAWGRRQQHLYRVLGANPGWHDEVLASVPRPLDEVVALNAEARNHLNALLATERRHDTLPAWRIDDPRPADELLGYYRDAADTTGVPWSILAAINLIETRMGRISGVSTAGAVGPMQFLPTTWAECCTGDPTDPRDAIHGAGQYLVDRGAARDLDRAIWGYNNSDHYVGAVRAYAAVLDLDERAYAGYHAWEVHYLSTAGLVRLPVGYAQETSIDAAAWVAANPANRVETAPAEPVR